MDVERICEANNGLPDDKILETHPHNSIDI